MNKKPFAKEQRKEKIERRNFSKEKLSKSLLVEFKSAEG